jgi:hypothetical protein
MSCGNQYQFDFQINKGQPVKHSLKHTLMRCSVAIAVAAMCGVNAKADLITFDTTLASPDTTAANLTNNLSWYSGSGNQGVQGGWTVDTNNGIEIGLRAKYRQVNSVIDTPNNVYGVAPGLQDATHALWNYEFSIDLRPAGVGTLMISDILNSTLTVTDLNTLATNTVLLSALAGDYSGFGTAGGTTGANRIDESPGTIAAFLAGWGAQNSENPMFGNFPLSGFDPNAGHTYEFNLKVIQGTSLLASNTIDVQVAPEPTAAIPVGIIVLSLLIFARRRAIA